MSIEIYRPNGPNTEPSYPIGTIGWEYNNKLFKTIDIALDAIRTLGSLKEKGFATVASFLLGAIDGNGAVCPTYGLWAGQGWAGGQRLASSENAAIRWEKEPCYNSSITAIKDNPNLLPESCYSLVDAITKTHDWMYTLAENQLAANQISETQYKNALLAADVVMLQNHGVRS